MKARPCHSMLRFQKTPLGRKLETKGNKPGNETVSTYLPRGERPTKWKREAKPMGNENSLETRILVSLAPVPCV